MKKIFFLFAISISLLFYSCASIHLHNFGNQVDEMGNIINKKSTSSGLIVSGEELTEFSSPNFGFLVFTIENKSSKWINLKNLKVDFGNELRNQNIKFTSGKDLITWNEAITTQRRISDYNKRVFLSSLVGFGELLIIGSEDEDVQRAGALIGFGALTSLSVDEFNKQKTYLKLSNIFPEGNLFNEEIYVPPGLFVKKWLLVNTNNHQDIGFIDTIFLEYETENGTAERIQLKFRSLETNTKWQRDVDYNTYLILNHKFGIKN